VLALAALLLAGLTPVRGDGQPIQTCDMQRECLKWSVNSVSTCTWQVGGDEGPGNVQHLTNL
jgi:hypothetical protein